VHVQNDNDDVDVNNKDESKNKAGTWMRMDELQIGDNVLTGSSNDDGGLSYSKIYSFGHYAPDHMGNYLQIQAEGMNKPLEISAQHLIYIYNNHPNLSGKKFLVPAQDIKVGDSLVSGIDGTPATVRSIRKVQLKGVFAPYTFLGNIVVNQVLASNYVMLANEFPDVSPGKQHFMYHALNAPHHVYCRLVGGCCCQRATTQEEECDEQTGFSASTSLQFALLQWYMHQRKPFKWHSFIWLLQWVMWFF